MIRFIVNLSLGIFVFSDLEISYKVALWLIFTEFLQGQFVTERFIVGFCDREALILHSFVVSKRHQALTNALPVTLGRTGMPRNQWPPFSGGVRDLCTPATSERGASEGLDGHTLH